MAVTFLYTMRVADQIQGLHLGLFSGLTKAMERVLKTSEAYLSVHIL